MGKRSFCREQSEIDWINAKKKSLGQMPMQSRKYATHIYNAHRNYARSVPTKQIEENMKQGSASARSWISYLAQHSVFRAWQKLRRFFHQLAPRCWFIALHLKTYGASWRLLSFLINSIQAKLEQSYRTLSRKYILKLSGRRMNRISLPSKSVTSRF